ncbi:MAG: hypothetical protein E5V79_04255 [Mesorhizobium sp.]|nr:MAG: hypothetical protein E5V79_04255 [Mesorhizobium sp.]
MTVGERVEMLVNLFNIKRSNALMETRGYAASRGNRFVSDSAFKHDIGRRRPRADGAGTSSRLVGEIQRHHSNEVGERNQKVSNLEKSHLRRIPFVKDDPLNTLSFATFDRGFQKSER